MSEIILMSDPSVAAMPVAECGEPLVDVRRGASLLVDTRLQDPADAFAHLRGRPARAAAQGPGDRRPTSLRTWWHWSFGDRYWALPAGEAAACYGPRG
jgi:hypothetical protein